ncbi:hypothetical protein CAC42_7951 [Sphaceloma murrayae]|uniref:Apple domain-containing protein n=1 Tax=Sphaceloma murrayae TaxID=2082308 RepID=A0A2K1QY48_9PEZI|nr:hypothetical protein CAC42_7951 [Sphaceloma murrayae]
MSALVSAQSGCVNGPRTINGRTCRVECGTKRPGDSYRTVNVDTLPKCIRACANDQRCRHAQYRRGTGNCFLKSTVNARTSGPLFDSVVCDARSPSVTSQTASSTPTAHPNSFVLRAVASSGAVHYLRLSTADDNGSFLYNSHSMDRSSATSLGYDASRSSLTFSGDNTLLFSQSFQAEDVLRLKTDGGGNGQIATARNTAGNDVLVRSGERAQLDPWALCETDLTLAGQVVVKYLPEYLMDGCTRVQLVMER